MTKRLCFRENCNRIPRHRYLNLCFYHMLIWKIGNWWWQLTKCGITPYYFITVYKEGEEEGKWVRSRTWGFLKSFKAAEKAVLENWTDMYEANHYDKAVIEKCKPSLLALMEDIAWYEANYSIENGNNPVVKKVPKPEWTKGVINFGGLG